MIKQFARLSKEVQRYLIIGVSVYVFELGLIVTAQALGAGSLLAVGLAYWLGLLTSFILQKVVTFGDKRAHHRILLPQIIAFALLVVFNFGFTLLLTDALSPMLPAVLCRSLALGITTIWNFYLYKTRIFNQSKNTKWSGQRRPALKKRLQKRHKQLLRRYRKWRNQPHIKRLRKRASTPRFGKLFLAFSFLVLFATVLLWSLLGAQLQQSNADQLIIPHLLADGRTLHGAQLPGQHTFLVKWPLFYLIRLLGYAPGAFLWLTVAVVLLTVAAFIVVLSRIEKRPLVLGMLCLLLSSALLLVPAQPYAGALLPVNMAMLATRNLEYILYIIGLYWLIRAPRLRSRQFWAATAVLALLIASDRLFLFIGGTAAFAAMLCYALTAYWKAVGLAARWLVSMIAAGTGAVLILAALNWFHVLRIVGSQGGPYNLVTGFRPLVIGVVYAVGGLLTNFGANPAYDAVTFGQLPHRAVSHLLSPALLAYAGNFLLFCWCFYVFANFMLQTFFTSEKKTSPLPRPSQFSLLMAWSGITTVVLFVFTNHYYQVDARYLTLCFFTLFVLFALWLRPRRVDPELVVTALPAILVVILCAVVGAVQTYHAEKSALQLIDHRNKIVAQTLASHHVRVLVGDYWRVLPVQSLSKGRQQQILPLQSCDQPRSIWTSTYWQPDLHHTSFAYLLTLHGSMTDYPDCSLGEVSKIYGAPNSSVLISGSLAEPKELLLFYDRGIPDRKKAVSASDISATVLPVSLGELPRTTCSVPTTVNVVAHQDDDLLFMNPDIQNDITEGRCVRTIYLTAGDAGYGRPYWLAREQGSEAAYNKMMGSKSPWVQQIARIPGGQFVTVATPKDNDRISLIFMHVPDGNLHGQGFSSSHHQSLAELKSGQTRSLQTVDRQSRYTAKQLTAAITILFHTYQPAGIRMQSSDGGQEIKDHSDHLASGWFATQAYGLYEEQQFGDQVTIPLTHYLGYPVRQQPANIRDGDLQSKETVFLAYAHFDKSVCRTHDACVRSQTYGSYLAREYQNPE